MEVAWNTNFVERPAKPQKQSSLGKDNNSHPPGASRGQRSPMKLSAPNENWLAGQECGGVVLPYGPQLFSDTQAARDATLERERDTWLGAFGGRRRIISIYIGICSRSRKQNSARPPTFTYTIKHNIWTMLNQTGEMLYIKKMWMHLHETQIIPNQSRLM